MREQQHEVMGGGLRELAPVENKNFAPLLEKVDNDILDYWLMLSNDERETEWNNYTDEEKEELNEKREQLLFMLYWDS
jgi:hypothetical protein